MNSEQFRLWCKGSTFPPVFPAQSHKPLIMGVLNVTPDSFSDGGRFLDPIHAYEQAMRMVAGGADLIDIGGESSKPGAEPISAAEELNRVMPVIARIRAASDVCMAIDTYKAEVMREAVAAGVGCINDIMGLRSENALSTAATLGVPVCLMHMQGHPQSMQNNPSYAKDVVAEINDFFKERMIACQQAGIPPEYLILDPGFGFGKSVQHNLNLVKRMAEFHLHKRPLLLGVSRKSTLGILLKKPVSERLIGGIAISVFAALQGVTIIRTHDVEETRQALHVVDAIIKGGIEKE
ncbi:dihydropteroate synthase [Legionella septentrionalis]|nr:dihydropteroate synthase [Legionella septentrionalis]